MRPVHSQQQRLPASLAIRRKRAATNSSSIYSLFAICGGGNKRKRRSLFQTFGITVAIMALVLFQFVSFHRQSIPTLTTDRHSHHQMESSHLKGSSASAAGTAAGPIQQALQEQRLRHQEHRQQQQQQQQQNQASNNVKEQRRRLNATQGNKSTTITDKQQHHQQQQDPVVLTNKENVDPTIKTFTLTNNIKKVTEVAAAANAAAAAAKRNKPKRAYRVGAKEPKEKLTGDDASNDNNEGDNNNDNNTTTTGLNRATQQSPPKNTPPPFKLRRSVPDAPAPFENRTLPLDPLESPDLLSQLTRTNYTLRSKWHGVLLDAGRHYFEVDWIKRMLDVLAILQYNSLHFRLTDDQAFNVRLDSQPNLAHPVGLFGNNKTYTPSELRDIVAYAKTKGIVIWPEVNVPGHGGGWAGIPGLVVQCPQFICEKGYGVPINVTHPKFRPILTDVLREIVDIFDNPPYLHLGGDEVDMAKPCFDEVKKPMFDYDIFEATLSEILKDINYPEEQVIRWEMTGQRLKAKRAGNLPQYWFRIPGESAPNMGHNAFLASGGLYFDFNEMDMAWQIYLYTRRYYHLPHDNFPVGIIVGTFELDSTFWYDRNVIGRLLAVTMGASEEVNAKNGKELYRMYEDACKAVGFDDNLCHHYGLPFISWKEYKNKWNDVWDKWKGRICDRLAIPGHYMAFVPPEEQQQLHGKKKLTRHTQGQAKEGASLERFWDKFGTEMDEPRVNLQSDTAMKSLKRNANLKVLMDRHVNNVGIVMDLTIGDPSDQMLGSKMSLLHQMHAMGFNLIQLRMVSDHGFAFQSETVPQATQVQWDYKPTIHDINRTLVWEASRLGIGVIPEISISTNAAGMYSMGYNLPCPRFTCQKGAGIQNINDPKYTAVAYGLVREVAAIATTGLLHLGSDERDQGNECFAELPQNEYELEFESFEMKLAYLLLYDKFSSSQIIRWSNQESVDYPGRLGSITQCREGDCRNDKTRKWFATVDIHKGGAYNVFHATQELALRKPDAIFAEIGRVDNATLFRKNIAMRMLAFAMGTSNLNSWSQGMFEESFVPLCVSLFHDKASCEAFAKHTDGAAGDYRTHNTFQICKERTKNVTRYSYRPEFM